MIDAVERILDAKSVNHAYPMAPACGLYLGTVKYDLPWILREDYNLFDSWHD